MATCQGFTKAGRPCRAASAADSRWCWRHRKTGDALHSKAVAELEGDRGSVKGGPRLEYTDEGTPATLTQPSEAESESPNPSQVGKPDTPTSQPPESSLRPTLALLISLGALLISALGYLEGKRNAALTRRLQEAQLDSAAYTRELNVRSRLDLAWSYLSVDPLTQVITELPNRREHRIKISKASDLIEAALKIDPTNPRAHRIRGVYFEAIGRWGESITEYCTAIELDPDYAEAYNSLGVLLLRRGDHHRAAKALGVAVALDPNEPLPHYNLGLVFYYLGFYDQAAAELGQAVLLDDADPDFYYTLGLTLHELGRLDEAVEAYTKALRLKPTLGNAHYNMGLIYEEGGRLEDAHTAYGKAQELAEDSPEGELRLSEGEETTEQSSLVLVPCESALDRRDSE